MRLRFKKLISVLLFASSSYVSVTAAANGPSCQNVFQEENLRTIETQLQFEKENLQNTIDSLRISLENVRPIRYLGKGAEGIVFEVQIGKSFYAIKMSPYITPSQVIIQKALGQLGLAPKIYGVSETDFQKWIGTFPEVKDFAGLVKKGSFAIIMELTTQNNLKDAKQIIKITSSQYKKLNDQAEHIAKVLTELKVIAQDIDAVINFEGNLMLIDFGLYSFIPESDYNQTKRILRELKGLIDMSTVKSNFN